MLKVAAPDDMRFRDALIAEKGEPISDYHLDRLDELLEGELDRLQARSVSRSLKKPIR